MIMCGHACECIRTPEVGEYRANSIGYFRPEVNGTKVRPNVAEAERIQALSASHLGAAGICGGDAGLSEFAILLKICSAKNSR